MGFGTCQLFLPHLVYIRRSLSFYEGVGNPDYRIFKHDVKGIILLFFNGFNDKR